MKKVYTIEFTEDYQIYKKGEVTAKFSRDNANMIVNTLGVAKYYVEKKVKSKSKK